MLGLDHGAERMGAEAIASRIRSDCSVACSLLASSAVSTRLWTRC